MSGYLQRLMARSAGAGVGIHPLSRLPHASLSEVEPLGDHGEFVAASPSQQQPTWETEWHATVTEPSARDPAPAASLRYPAVQMSNATTAEEPAAARAPPNPPPLIPVQALEEGSISVRRTAAATPAAHAFEVQKSEGQNIEPQQGLLERTAERFPDQAPELFRLMAPTSSGLAHDAVSSGRALSFSPETGAGRVQAANLALQVRPSTRSQKAEPGEAEATEVHVRIGRIEITAVQAPVPPKRKQVASRKPLSLDDYLAQRGRA